MTSPEPISNDEFTVYVVDPNVAFRDALTLTLGYRGYCLRQFSTRGAFLAARAPGWRGCVLANIVQPDGSGLEFLTDRTGRRQTDLPLPVVLVGADTAAAVVRQAFLGGAIDVLPSPVDLEDLLLAIDRAMKVARDRRASEPPRKHRGAVPSVLTRREIEVAELVRQGYDNRSIGDRLAISHRTVEVHKTRLMRKLGVASLADLMALPLPGTPRLPRRGRSATNASINT